MKSGRTTQGTFRCHFLSWVVGTWVFNAVESLLCVPWFTLYLDRKHKGAIDEQKWRNV